MKQKQMIIGFWRSAVLSAAALLCVCGAARADDGLTAAVEHVVAGRWEAAMTTLQSQGDTADSRVQTLTALLREHQAIEQQRQHQRQAVFDEEFQALEALQWDAADEGDLFRAMRLFKSAWDNATEPQRQTLLAGPVYASLSQAVENRFTTYRQAGQWDTAWSNWLRWLVIFELRTYQQAADDLQQSRDAATALRKNPCDETQIPYAQVNRNTAVRVFELLDTQYVEPLPYAALAAGGLRRLAIVPEVLTNPHITAAFEVDSDGVEQWSKHLNALNAQPPAVKQKAELIDLMDTLLAINAKTLKLPEGVIVGQFTEAALAALDPYTEAVWPEGVGQFEKDMTGQFGGIGIRINQDGQDIVISSIIPGTPAAETILAPNDIIVAVDGRLTREMITDCAVKLISGPVGTAVSLTIRREGVEDDQRVTLTRQKIVLPTVEGAQRADNGHHQGHWDYFLDVGDRIGYLHLHGFTDKTAEQAKGVLEALEAKQIAGLIVDMRGNGGGLLSEAVAFANLFIDEGVLLSSRGRDGKTTTWEAKSNAVKRSYPIVILIDEDSASASEIVAGAVAARTDGQATLIGQRTFGKGSVQEVVNLGKTGGRLKLTTGYYYLPDGRPVNNRYKLQAEGRTDWGVAPTIEIPLYAYERSQVRQIQLQRRQQLTAVSDAKADTETLHADSLAQQMLMADAQLSAAVVVLKARIMAAAQP